MKKILILTDSLGLPREHNNDIIQATQTWPSLLSKKFDVCHLGIGGATIDILTNQAAYHRFFYPNIIIVQSGIVDCAPRTLTRREKNLIENLPFVGRFIYPIIKRYNKQIRKWRNAKLSTEELYRSNVKKIISLFDGKPVYFIGILPASKEYEKIVPGITKSIITFNNILKQEAKGNYINMDTISQSDILGCHHHLSISGNEYLYKKIIDKLNK